LTLAVERFDARRDRRGHRPSAETAPEAISAAASLSRSTSQSPSSAMALLLRSRPSTCGPAANASHARAPPVRLQRRLA
jgi:hypothetical protein